MIQLTTSPPVLPSDLSLYYTKDPLLEDLPVLVFYGSSTTGNSTQNTSRIQAHVFSIAGFHSFPRLTIAPTSPLYAAVNHLPSELQGDEISRGLAVSLLSYFAALSKEAKASLRDLAGSRRPNGIAPMMFDEMHAGELAADMEAVEGSVEVSNYLIAALSAQTISWLDMDIILPSGTIKQVTDIEGQDEVQSFSESGLPLRVLSKDAKISLRREMCELVDTENSYCDKLADLIKEIALSFREKGSSKDVDALFPESLDQILKLSSAFCDEIQTNLDVTEDEAIRDIEGQTQKENGTGTGKGHDPTGALEFAKALLAWFPRFLAPYQDYLRSSNQFAKIIGDGLQDASSSIAASLSEIGEQRLRSALIEPVQRLPRYSLLIDNMINLLPSSHPSLHSFLKARDIITDICALETSNNSDDSRASRILSTIVREWPASLSPKGRLINAFDVIEMDPPFASSNAGKAAMILLFPERIVLLDKLGENGLSARGVIAEVDRPTMFTNVNILPGTRDERTLRVSESFELSNLLFTESSNARVAHMTRLVPAHQFSGGVLQTGQIVTKSFGLQGSFDGKAARLSEEVAKARIEGRYSETVRESGKWALQIINNPEGLRIVAALSENGPSRDSTHRKLRGQIRLSLEASTVATNLLERDEQDTAMSMDAQIATPDFMRYILTVDGLSKTHHRIECTIENVVPSLLKQLNDLCRKKHELMVDYHTFYFRNVLNAIPIRKAQAETKFHNYRPISPIKMLSKVFGGDSTPSSTPSKLRREAPIMKSLPSLPQPPPISNSQVAAIDHDSDDRTKKATLVDANAETYTTSLALLEDTFIAYIVALHSRSGNVVGKILRNRATADELTVNELYNTLLEDPGRIQIAAEVPVDALFAAFEKFLKRAWKERMGPLIAPGLIQNLQLSFDAGQPTVFTRDFKILLDGMSPQSRRCFAAMVKLLSELLDASGNDGDRGILIASFAEALILTGNPHDYINLLDRLVDDYDNLFDDAAERPGTSGSATGSLNRTRSFNTGSLSSNTSSLRRKFGLGGGLSRENSRNESESKVASIWRTLSKNARSPGESHSQGNSQPGSISKASLLRSRSTDRPPQMFPPLRPITQDRPTNSSSRTSPEPRSRPGSSHNTLSTLSIIGEGTLMDHTLPSSKKKRRSSLSDLVKSQEIPAASSWSPLHPRKLPVIPGPTAKVLPKTPSFRNTSLNKHVEHSSPPGSRLPQRFGSPQRKENSSLGSKSPSKENTPSPRTTQLKKQGAKRPGEVTIKSYAPQRQRTPSRSTIPAPKGGLSERPGPANTHGTPPKKTSIPSSDGSPRKLRIQSPQKIRERLNQEQKILTGTENSLQKEIDKISEEMSAFKLRAPDSSSRPTSSSSAKSSASTLESLSHQLYTLSKNLHTFSSAHTATTDTLRTDLEKSLSVADRRAKKLDELYKDANAENEALYDRFNDELAKILGRVKKGEGVDEMNERLAEALKEVGSLRAERAKLKREVVGLRSLVKESG